MTDKIPSFLIGALVGAAAVSLLRKPLVRNGVVRLIGAGLQLKEEASAFMETVKEEAEDMFAEAEHRKTQNATE